jgi:hypothetical protein
MIFRLTNQSNKWSMNNMISFHSISISLLMIAP